MTTTSTSSGILDSLRLYDALRLNATAVTRHEGSNIDHFVTSSGKEITLCHLSGLLPFSFGDFVPQLLGFEWSANVALAAHHLNTGDGSIVPEVEGLDKRCKIRFTTEFIDTQFSEGVTLNHVIAQTNRELGSLTERNPCAFIGATRSAVSIPTSIVTGLLGYPQISPASTSIALDDKSQFPLFGRTLPSDDGNAVPIIRFMREVLQIKHLAIINVNDSYGNNFAQGLRKAAEIHAPDMVLYQVPLDEDEGSMEAAIASVKKTGFRYIFCLVFTEETHDLLLTEGYKQGVAGNGVHNWVFADSFLGTLNGRTFEKGSTLHKVYTGTGLIEVSGGVPGIPSFDNYQNIVEKLRNPTDLEYLASIWPSHDHPQWGTETPFVNSDMFLKDLSVSYSAFNYEAAISLGLAACAAHKDNETFTGQDHFDYFRKLTFTGVSGKVVFDPITGTRLPGSALYKVTNFIEHEVDKDSIEFKSVVTDLFQNDDWVEVIPYIFNDGTSNLPVDIAPLRLDNEDINLGIVIGVPLAALVLLVSLLWMFYMHQKRLKDTLWEVKERDLKFSDPPKIIGQGKFGVVLLAEYRGTVVAVKRVIPPNALASGRHKMSSVISLNTSDDMDDEDGTLSTEDQVSPKPLQKPKSHDSGHTSLGMMSSGSRLASWGHMSIANFRLSRLRASNGSSILSRRIQQNKTEDTNSANRWKKLKRNFIHEMQYLSKLRHPCITTIMGAVLSNDPMLVLEYLEHGSLYDLLHNDTMVIEGDLLLPILRDISQGVRFLHAANPQVVHGDLKSANILVDRNFRAKVADFGLSQTSHSGGVGTPFWMAPEILRGEHGNTAASDVYSFGIILYEVYSRRDPYDNDDNVIDILRLVCDQKIQKRPQVPISTPEKVKALMAECVDDDPSKRPTFEEIDQRLQRIDCEGADPTQMSAKKAGISLFDMFPRHIAEALRDGKTVEPEHKESVTVFFSDIAGFSEMSSSLSARKVADLLDRLYTKLDGLSQKHDIFKVETIGDAYMAVTNLVKDQQDDHAKRVAEFAIDAIEAANSILIDPSDPEKGFVNIRCGFHSGSVVADVVGTRSPRYCLFGDTVNTASRMETNSKINRILCSEASYQLLKVQCPNLPVVCRGRIAIKGKGKMKTFWVNNVGDDLDPQPIKLLRKDSCSLRTLEILDEEANDYDVSKRSDVVIEDIEAPVPQVVHESPPNHNHSAQDVWVRQIVQQERAEQIRKATEKLNLYKAALR